MAEAEEELWQPDEKTVSDNIKTAVRFFFISDAPTLKLYLLPA
jgi:hypothetical protein